MTDPSIPPQEQPTASVPTAEQARLRRSYSRVIGTCTIVGLLVLSLAIYNVVKGLNAFNSLPMWIEVGAALAFLTPALVTWRRARRLDAIIAAGSSEVPRHMRTWQAVLVTVGLVAFVLVILPATIGLISRQLGPTVEEQQAQAWRDSLYKTLTSPDVKSGEYCAMMKNDPTQRAGMIQGLSEGNTSYYPALTQAELAQILIQVTNEFCGISGT